MIYAAGEFSFRIAVIRPKKHCTFQWRRVTPYTGVVAQMAGYPYSKHSVCEDY
jgi:hypothetical protein